MKRLFLLATALASLTRSTGAATCPPSPFIEAPSYPAGPNPVAIVVANFNADSIPDLAVADRDGYGVSVLLGNGDGTFGLPIFSDTNYSPLSLAAGDFDGDGIADLAVGTYSGLSILIGNGDGSFQPPVPYSFGSGGTYSIHAAKLDAGDTLDLVATSDYTTSVYVLLGNGDGTFGPATPFAAGGQTRSLALGDFDGDGATDVIAAHQSGNTISLLLGQGDGTFGPPMSFVAGASPTFVVSADFNGDGHLDVAAQTGSYISVLLGNGAGSFGAALQYPAGDYPGAFVAGDFDGDSVTDLAVQNGLYTGAGRISILRGDGSGAFLLSAVYFIGFRGYGIAAGDLNGDGMPDLVTSNPEASNVSVVLADGNGSFEASRSLAVPGGASVLATGIFNEDSILDIATVNGGKVNILLGDPLGGYILAGSYDVGFPATFVLAADFTNDYITDLVVSSNYGYGVWLLRGVGDGTFVPAASGINTDSYPGAMVAGYFDAGGTLDLAVAHGCCGFGGIDILPGNGDGTFQAPQNIDLASTPGALVVSDLNSDGALDLATTDAGNGRVLVLLGAGDGTFHLDGSYAVQSGPRWLLASDIDGDGNTDLVVANTDSQNLSILRGNGDGTFATGPILGLGQPLVFVGVGFLDGNDLPDLYTANGSGNSVSVFPGLGGGSFGTPTTYATGANATFAAIVDADNNSQADLAVATPGDNTITLLLSSLLGISPAGGSGEACVGSSVTLSARASGFGPITFQWKKDTVPLSDGGNISGAQTAHLTISPVGPSDYGNYSIVATDLCSSLESVIEILIVRNPPAVPVIAVDSLPAPGIDGSASVAAGGSSYAWTATGAVMTGGQGSNAITFRSDIPGTVTLKVTEYSAPGCGTDSAATDVPVDYLDVPPSNIFYGDIVEIAQARITAGCGNGNYCPTNPVSRAQMAVFLLKSLYGSAYMPPASAQQFQDVPPGSFAYDWINALASLGVTGGCGGGNYCPGDSVTRAQMSVFLLKAALGPGYTPPAATGIFGDVPPGSFAADWIEDLYNRGITGGCSASPLLYCPGNPVTRGQMAAFLVNTFSFP